MLRWELDLWNEMWERAGSRRLDTWYELPDGTWNGDGQEPDGSLDDIGPEVGPGRENV